MSEIMNIEDYVKVIRFDNNGFVTKPYNATKDIYPLNGFCHSFPFIFGVNKILDDSNLTLPKGIRLVNPEHNDTRWNGCFAFLETYNENLLNHALSFRANSKKNVAWLKKDKLVWARNINYKGELLYSSYTREIKQGEGKAPYEYKETIDEHYWVLMPVETLLERIKKAEEYFGETPGEIHTEIYLMEEQVKELIHEQEQCKGAFLKKWIKSMLSSINR
ncbi:hypothetical protein D7X33_18415 [Butyricicoccus sp. 1XD8-22]|nr:hypothetical protein D7X33_18415 [Butyricicoccus sp. 1XD8-22]